jgi:glycosyltransferase involved in cell wall biosynthesis
VIDAIFASEVARRFELVRFATNHPGPARRGPLGRAGNAALARTLGLDGAWNLDARDVLARFAAALDARPDLVHLHSWHGWDFWLAARMARLARLRGAASLLHVHGNFDAFEPTWSGAKRAAFRRALRAPDRLVVLSESWERWFTAWMDAARIEVVPNGVDTERFRPAAERPLTPLRVLFLGTRDPDTKGAYDLLAAAPSIFEAVPSAQIIFAGEDAERIEARCVRGREWASRCEFVGALDRTGVEAQLAAAHLLVLPSHREAFPVALLEAMACGLPVVASDLHAIREALPVPDGGALVAPGDAGATSALASAMIALLRDASWRARAAVANRARVAERYDQRRFAAAIDRLYTQALAPAAQGGSGMRR